MCKKLYKTAIFFILLMLMDSCFSDSTQPLSPSTPASGTAAQNGQVAISASQKQLTQIKALFDHADYNHLDNPSNAVGSLMLDE